MNNLNDQIGFGILAGFVAVLGLVLVGALTIYFGATAGPLAAMFTMAVGPIAVIIVSRMILKAFFF